MTFEALAKQLDAPDPQKWEPSEGDRLLGTLRRIRYVSGMSFYAIITIEDQDGAYWDVSCGPATLKRDLSDLKPQPGDLIGVSFEGIGVTKNDREFKKYRVAVEHKGERITGTEFDLERAQSESDGDLGFTDSWQAATVQDDPIESIPLWAKSDGSDDEPEF